MYITRILTLPLILMFAFVVSIWTEVTMAQEGRINFSQQKKRVTPQIEMERARFTFLTLQNPNYFGNLKASVLDPITTIIGNTKYEEIECVGFNPDFDRLEAVVLIKKSSGYGGGICSNGSPEYVRFYLSYDGGSTWKDQGITSFHAFNIPCDKPLEYAATLQISPSKGLCISENLPIVRAILSWKNPPPEEAPDWLPVWGQVKEARIQIGSRDLFLTADLFNELKINLPLKYQNLFDLKQELNVLEAVPLNGIELQELYRDKPVQPSRYLFKDVHELILEPKLYKIPLLPKSIEYLQQLQVDWAQLIDDFQLVDGRTKYEELKCVGLNTNLDTLVGILTVKLPSGYSGNLCSAGSTEYIAFWVDWGGGWEHAGTGSVSIHDLTTIPDEGLQFALHVPIDVATHRRPCQYGPTTARVRAILSWQTEPPSNNPNYVPTWGNRKETLIHIPSGDLLPGDILAPEFYTVGGMSPNDISTPSGLANGPAVTAGFTAIDSPFGARVFLAGKIHNAPDLPPGPASLVDYRVSVRQLPAGSWMPLNDDLKLKLIPWPGGIGAEYTVTQSAPDGWYEYLADPEGPNTIDINGDILAIWDTGSRTGTWQIKVDARDSVSNTFFPGSQLITVRLDNQAPSAAIAITSGGGDCADFLIGDVIQGTYSATDQHFNFLRLSVAPWLGGNGFIAPLPATAALPQMPLTRSYPIVLSSGESGIWQLDTTGMPRCGYVTYLHVRDRTIVNSGHIGRHTSVPVGLCLREEQQ